MESLLCSVYHDQAPMLNHPGCLKMSKGGCGQNISWVVAGRGANAWLQSLKPEEYNNLEKDKNSPKLIILAHILAMALQGQEKVLIYSKCLKTLDLVESFMGCNDWSKRVTSLSKEFSSMKLGGMKKGKDYLRIDGSTDSGKRGTLVDKFNTDDDVKIFLVSALAGGIGINLVSLCRIAELLLLLLLSNRGVLNFLDLIKCSVPRQW